MFFIFLDELLTLYQYTNQYCLYNLKNKLIKHEIFQRNQCYYDNHKGSYFLLTWLLPLTNSMKLSSSDNKESLLKSSVPLFPEKNIFNHVLDM